MWIPGKLPRSAQVLVRGGKARDKDCGPRQGQKPVLVPVRKWETKKEERGSKQEFQSWRTKFSRLQEASKTVPLQPPQ